MIRQSSGPSPTGAYQRKMVAAGYRSELLALRWENVNLGRGIIEIRCSMSTAKVKGEAAQEKVRWFDPKTKQGNERFRFRPS